MRINITIVGATGAVGQEIIGLMEGFSDEGVNLKLLASGGSVGKRMGYKGGELLVEELGEGVFDGVDYAIFCTPANISRRYVPEAVKAGALVIDNSSSFRHDEGVPLVIPEINGDELRRGARVVANPNCSTIIGLMGLWPLHREYGLKRVVASTYQAVSGAGSAGLKELEEQMMEYPRAGKREVFGEQIMLNVIPKIESINEQTGYTYEEEKFKNEARKILGEKDLAVSVTCVRVPVMRSHCVSINAEFEKEFDMVRVAELLGQAQGVLCEEVPTPLKVTGKKEVYVGRLRRDFGVAHGLSMFVVGDQVLKGAALNAFQILEFLIKDKISENKVLHS